MSQHVADPGYLRSSVIAPGPLQVRIVSLDDAEAAAWGAVLAGAVGAAAIGWYVVGAGLRLDVESDGGRALRAVMLSLGAPLAIAATAGAGDAGYRLVIDLR